MITNTRHEFFVVGGGWGGGGTLASSIPSIWLAQALAGDPTETTFAVLVYLCLFDIFQDSQLAEWGLGSVYGYIPLRFRKKTAWDKIGTPGFHDLLISGHLLGHLNHQELCLVNRICSNTTPNDL